MDSRLLEYPLYGGTLLQWLIALGITLAIVLAARIALPLLTRRLEALSKRTRLGIDDAVTAALRATRQGLVTVVAISVGSQALELSDGAQKILGGVATVALFLQVGLWLAATLAFWLRRSEQRAQASHPGAVTSLAAVGFIGRIVLWAIIL